MDPKSNDTCPYETEGRTHKRAIQRWRKRLERFRYKPKNAKDCQQAAESRREAGDEVLFNVSRKSPNLATLRFWTSGPRTARKSISIVLGHLVYDNLLEQP